MLETIHFQLLLATFAGWINRRQALVAGYLVEENRVLKEQLESSGKRLRFTDNQRLRLAAKGKLWDEKAFGPRQKSRDVALPGARREKRLSRFGRSARRHSGDVAMKASKIGPGGASMRFP